MSQKPQPQQTVKLAIDCQTGEVLPAEELLAMTEEDFTRLRREAMEARIQRRKEGGNAARFECAICKQPLFLSRRRIGGAKNRWFVHDGASESCPWYSGDHLTPNQIKALIYRGQQEGRHHRDMKQFIASWLKNDPAVSQVSQEQTTFSETASGEWRRPDVKCLYRGIPLVFEIQLSYTFLSDVIARDDFYKEANIFIIWVFAHFDLSRAAVADEAFFNRRNLFVLNEDAKNQTIKRKALTFTGYHQEPQFRDNLIHDIWTSRLIGLDDVFFPEDTKRPYFFDYGLELKRLKAEHREQQQASWEQGIREYREAAIKYYESDYSQQLKKPLLAIVDKLEKHPNWNRDYRVLRNERFFGYRASVLPTLLSIQLDKPIGYKLKSVFQVIEAGLRRSHPTAGKRAFAVLYLSAYTVYKPTVSNKQWLNDEIELSVNGGEVEYRGFDEAIKILFPKLKDYSASQLRLMNP